MSAKTMALACSGVLWTGWAGAQTSVPQDDPFWRGAYDSCLTSMRAPDSSTLAKRYCECNANMAFEKFDFDGRLEIAAKIAANALDQATKDKLHSLMAECLKKIIQK